MKRILGYLRRKRIESILAPLLKCGEATLDLLVPLVMRQIIDEGIPAGDTSFVIGRGFVLLVLGIAGLGLSIIAQYFAADASYALGTDMRRDLFAHVNSLSMNEMDSFGISKLINHINTDVFRVQDGVNLFLRLFLRSPFIVVGSVVLSFIVEPSLAWIMLASVPIQGLVIVLVSYYGVPLVAKSQSRMDWLALLTRENLRGARVVRAFQRMDTERENFKDSSTALKKMQIVAGYVTELMNPLTYVLLNLVIVALLFSGSVKVNAGLVTAGTVIALMDYMSQIMTEMLRISNLVVSLAKAGVSVKRVNKIFDTESSMQEGTVTEAEPIEECLRFDHVSFRYGSEQEDTLKDISFTVRRGMVVGVIGGTGEGKSTLVKLIPRLYDVADGSVQLDGVDVRDYTFVALRSKMAVVPQHAVLFRGSVRENMQMGKPDASDEEITYALSAAQALDFVQKKPGGLDYEVQKQGTDFSGGQRQRLSIARALVRKPEIVILDDSFSALDVLTDRDLRRNLRDSYQDTTVFLVTQRVSTVMGSDLILVLSEGRLEGSGTHEELVANCPIYRDICVSQQIVEKEDAEA